MISFLLVLWTFSRPALYCARAWCGGSPRQRGRQQRSSHTFTNRSSSSSSPWCGVLLCGTHCGRHFAVAAQCAGQVGAGFFSTLVVATWTRSTWRMVWMHSTLCQAHSAPHVRDGIVVAATKADTVAQLLTAQNLLPIAVVPVRVLPTTRGGRSCAMRNEDDKMQLSTIRKRIWTWCCHRHKSLCGGVGVSRFIRSSTRRYPAFGSVLLSPSCANCKKWCHPSTNPSIAPFGTALHCHC
jgi:hypothetical protein